MTVPESDLLTRAYQAFNARDIPGALALMHPEVQWANGFEGGWVHGREAVGAYWTRQWAAIDPRVDPIAFRPEAPGQVVVTVHQVVRDLSGALIADQQVEHVYTFEDGLVKKMEIRAE